MLAFAAVRYVAPFQDRQIETFAHNWHARFQESPAAAETKAQDLVSAIHASPRTLHLARVPNLLTLMALIHRIQARLPHGRALLYGKIVEAYLESIDAYRGLREVGYSLEEKRRWLSWVGFRMQRRRETEGAEDRQRTAGREILVDEEELLAWLEEAMACSPRGGDVAEPGQAARAFVEYIARRSGLLLPRGQGRYAFTHLSFQEFFAALHLAERITSPRWFEKGTTEVGDGPADLEAYADQDPWREPLVLLFGLLAGRPEWSEELAELLVGKGFSKLLDDEESKQRALAQLLAEVSADPHSGLPGDLRRRAWEACWRWELRRQANAESSAVWVSEPVVARILLGVEEEDGAAIWAAFLTVAREVVLQRLSLRGAAALRDLAPLAELEYVEALNLFGTGISDLTGLAGLENLQELYLSTAGPCDLTPLAGLAHLRALYLLGTGVSDLTPLAALENLQELYLSTTGACDLTPLTGLAHLRTLYLMGLGVADLTPLAGLEKLRWLHLSGTAGVSDLTPLAGLENLERLDLWYLRVYDLSPLSGLAKLEALDLSGAVVSDLSPLAGLERLRRLDLSGTGVSDLTPLAGLEQLQWLNLSGTGVSDLTPLAGLEQLQWLNLSGTGVSDLTPLAGLDQLQWLDLPGKGMSEPDLRPLAALKSLHIVGAQEPQEGRRRAGPRSAPAPARS